MKSFCIVVSGLPASGKSTIGAKLAQQLDLRMLDKDDYLEALFVKRGAGNKDRRQQLSRESDKSFQRDAIASNSVLLVSHWRPPGSNSLSGTPTEWIAENFPIVVEVYCECSAELATKRFRDRKRHPGHQDESRNPEELLEWMRDYKERLPLSIGKLIHVDAGSDHDIAAVTKQLAAVITGLESRRQETKADQGAGTA